MKNIVVAYDMNGAIGSEGLMTWEGDQKDDMARFRTLTIGGAVIMGSNTWNSLDPKFRPLPKRLNIVASRTLEPEPGDEFVVARSLPDAFHIAESANLEEISVIGGGQIYEQAIDTVDRLFVTRIKTEIKNPDTFFPAFDAQKDWKLTYYKDNGPDARNKFGYTFMTYLRNNLSN